MSFIRFFRDILKHVGDVSHAILIYSKSYIWGWSLGTLTLQVPLSGNCSIENLFISYEKNGCEAVKKYAPCKTFRYKSPSLYDCSSVVPGDFL